MPFDNFNFYGNAAQTRRAPSVDCTKGEETAKTRNSFILYLFVMYTGGSSGDILQAPNMCFAHF